MKLNNLKIGSRLGLGFAAVLALMLLLTVAGLYSMHEIQKRLEHVLGYNDREIELLETMSNSIHVVARVTRTLIILHTPEEIEQEYRKIVDARARYDTARNELDKLPANEEQVKIQTRTDAARDAARAVNTKLVELARNNRDAEATEMLMRESIPLTDKWHEIIDSNIESLKAVSREDAAAGHAAYVRTSLLMLTLAALALILGASIAWVITRSITRPLYSAMSVAKAIAAGDLRYNIIPDGRDEAAQLMHSLREMNDSLVSIIDTIRNGACAIVAASQEIASGNLELSSRTEQQASSVEETASSMEELTATVKQNADNALQANQLARSASEVALQGGRAVADVVQKMDGITSSAKKISDIIGVIDDIAFQTNILALNAAVEAARAGEQGRGFAVVASEVRSLAQRSASAAKEIKSLITESVEKVDAGACLVDQAGTTMDEIVASVRRVTNIMDEIAEASRQQASGIAQVTEAVAGIDQAAQQNAALVEEATAAAESLKEQGAILLQSVSLFQVGNVQTTPPKLVHGSSSARQLAYGSRNAADSWTVF